MTQEELKIQINIGAETAEEAVKSLQSEIRKLGGDVDDLSGKTKNAEATQLAFAAAAAAAFGAMLGAINKGTEALNRYESAMKGLESVAGGRGIAQGELQKALDGVTDGFFSATAAAAAYKNLLTRGYSLDQATNAIMRLKDAAAFGRQASLSLEDAVVSATEGLKNENSVLVDNAGVTKNVAKMWEDYAKARGLVTANLTQGQKIEAEYIGIMQETQLQAGDLAKAANTLAGAQAEQQAQVTKLATAYGSALEPAVKTATNAITAFLGKTTEIVEGAPAVTSGVTTTITTFAALCAVLVAAKAATEKLTAAALRNPYVIAASVIAVAVGAIAGAYTNLANAEQRAAEEAAERAKQSTERNAELKAIEQESEKLKALEKRYQELSTKQDKSKTDTEELAEIVETLNAQYGIQVTSLGDVDKAYQDGQAAIQARIAALDAESKALVRLELEYQKAQLREAKAARDALMESDVFNEILSGRDEIDASDMGLPDISLELNEWITEVNKIAPEVAQQMEAARKLIYDSIRSGDLTVEERNEAIADLYEYFQAIAQSYADGFEQAVVDCEAAVNALEAYLAGDEGALSSYIATLQTVKEEGSNAFSETVEGAKDTADGLNQIDTILGNIQKELNATKKKLDWQKELLDDRKALKKAVDTMLEGGTVTEEWVKAIEAAIVQYGALNEVDLQGKLGAEIHYLENQNRMLDEQLNGMIRNVGIMLDQITAGAYGEITLNNAAAMEAIREVLAMLSATGLSIEDITGQGKKKGGGGGGGKSKAEQAAEDAKRAQEDMYRQQLEMIEHKRRMDQITADEELDLLIMVRNTYAQTAEQIREMDEKIHEARKALREAEEEQLTEMHEAVMEALEAQYAAQRDAEQKRIEESIRQWEEWSDETTAAIQKQIDALDEKAEAENREATAAEKLRAIDKIKQQMLYETDEYNLRQLQKQLAKAEEELAKTQAGWAKEDAKKALQEQMDAIEKEAQTQIDALEKESDAIDAHYEKMTEKARLELEAQEIMMRDSQESIIALLKEYAPDYEVVGKSFGEKFFDGFKSVLGDISSWFDSFAAAMEAPLLSAAHYATRSAQGETATQSVRGGATVTQNVTFNVPVETPSDTARKMQQVNEALAAML